VNNSIPSIASIVDDDVDLAVAKVSSVLYQSLDIFCFKNIARYSLGLTAVIVDTFSDGIAFFCDS
jgi:hypothetical protein